jgi:Tat protein translocase TatB subunit
MFNSVGFPELMVIFIVALLVFGPNKLPEIGRQIGRAMRELRQMQSSLQRELETALAEDPTPPTLPPITDGPAAVDGGAPSAGAPTTGATTIETSESDTE